MMKLWVAPKMGARTNIELVRRLQEYTSVFDGMTTGTALVQFKMFQREGWVALSECFITVSFVAE